MAHGVSISSVYRLAEQKAKAGSVDLRISERGRKRVLGPEACEQIAKTIEEQPDISLREIVERNTTVEQVLKITLSILEQAQS